MKLPKEQPFWTSVILHLIVLLGLFLATIVQAFKPKEKPHVFEMVEPASERSQSQASEPLPPLPVEIPAVDLPPVPQVEIVKPQIPTPQPSQQPAPTESKLVDYRDFSKEHPKEAPKPRPVNPRPSISVPQIAVPKLIVPRNPTPNSSSPNLSPQQMSALADYSSRLRSRIDAAWIKPAQLAGVRLVAEVIFEVSASGRITNVSLSPGSGNAAFDQSVLAAFRKASSAGPTPTGHSHQFSLPFRMSD